MFRADAEIYLAVVASTVLMILLCGVVGIAILRYRQRVENHLRDMKSLKETYQRELLQAQLETQNQTLEYIGQELHDNIGQMLSVAMLHLNGLEDELAQSAHGSAVHRMVETIEGTITAVRQLAKTLDKSTVQRFGLVESLTLELERIGQTGRYQTPIQVTGQPYALGEENEIILFRMVQESLNNALKHAQAKTLGITVNYQPNTFVLTVADDGRGFDQMEAGSRHLSQSGAGLHNLYQRAQLLGGSCTIDSQVGIGTRVQITLPHSMVQ